jgi:hypothetical protein
MDRTKPIARDSQYREFQFGSLYLGLSEPAKAITRRCRRMSGKGGNLVDVGSNPDAADNWIAERVSREGIVIAADSKSHREYM